MRITLVARHYWPAVGGVESFLRHVARGLARRHDVQVLAQSVDRRPPTRLSGSLEPYPSFEPFSDGAVAVKQIMPSSLRRASMAPLALQVVPVARRYAYGQVRRPLARIYARAVAPIIAREALRSDILHIWSGDFLASGGVRAGRLAGIPTAVTPFVHPGQWNDDPASVDAYRAADSVIGLLDSDAAVLRSLGVGESQVAVAGVCSPGLNRGQGEAVRREHGIQGPLVVFLGVRRPYKGFKLLLDAAQMLPAIPDDLTIAFLGPGEPVPIEASAARIIDVGEVSDRAKDAWLDAADLLCLPSESEIFPVSLLEAWSVETPVLVSDIPPLKELIERSGGGIAVDRTAPALARALLDCLRDRDQLQAMGAAGHRYWLEHYTVEALVRWHEREYARLIDLRRAAA